MTNATRIDSDLSHFYDGKPLTKKRFKGFFAVKVIKLVFLLLPFLTACTSSEEDARILLNQAIQEWDRGEFSQSLEKFDRVNTQYIETEAATESLKERTTRLENYKELSSSAHNRSLNKGIVGRDVHLKVEEFFKRTGEYPAQLVGEDNVYQGRYEDYIAQCTYQKSILNYGYQLDCSGADKTYNEERRQRLRKASEEIEAIKSAPRQPGNQSSNIITAADLKKAESTWGDYLNPNGKLPTKGFLAFYINTNEPRKLIFNEAVDDIAINYAWDQFHGIKSEDFGAYWVGNLDFKQKEIMRFAISQSWAKARILIDGAVLYEGGGDKELLFSFEPGVHRIEVEYVNNWHTTEFRVNINAQVSYLSEAEIKNRLKSNLLSDFEVYYAGVYESSAKDLTTTLNLEKTSRPILLVLSSYSPVNWHISNPFEVDIRGIVYGSHKPGSTLAGQIPESVLMFPAKTRIGSYDVSPKCSCSAGGFHCEGGTMITTVKALQALTEMPLSGFSGKYSAASLRLPEIKVNDRYLQEVNTKIKKTDEDRTACNAKNDPSFEKMFGK